MLALHELQAQCDHTLDKSHPRAQGSLQSRNVATPVGRACLGVNDAWWEGFLERHQRKFWIHFGKSAI